MKTSNDNTSSTVVKLIGAAVAIAFGAFAKPELSAVLSVIAILCLVSAGILYYRRENQQETRVQPPANPDQYPDLDESFSYERRPRSTYTPPTDPNAYPDLNQSFTYQSSRANYSSNPATRHVPLSYPGSNDNTNKRTLEPPPTTEVGGYAIYQHALEAIEATKDGLDKAQPVPVDLGLLVYRGAEKPNIHRTFAVPMDADYIQPYMQLYVPLPSLLTAATGRVKMEIQSGDDAPLFQHEAEYTLKPGLNLITPPARLPVKDAAKRDDLWQMRLTVGDRLVAWHTFGWTKSAPQELVTAVGSDGEISEALNRLLEKQVVETLSLDDLLAGDEDEDVKRA